MFITKSRMKIMLTICFIAYVFTAQIIPDPQNPIVISNPSTLDTSTLSFNFQLPPNTKGLQIKQFIAVAFPKSDSTVSNLGTSNFLFNTAAAASCKLYKNIDTEITVSFVSSQTGDENICYCQLTDDLNLKNALPLVAGVNYRLDITLLNASQKPSAIFWRNFDLFTKTSNSSNGFIIDSGISFGSGAIFGDFRSTKTSELLKIEDINNVDLSGNLANTQLYQYSSFNIKLRIKSYALIRGSDSLLTIKYPDTNLISVMPNQYYSLGVDDKYALTSKISSNLQFQLTDTNTHVLSGITDVWLQRNREFFLIITGLKCGDGAVASQKISLSVSYKNTNTVISYSEIYFLTVNNALIDLSVDHAESWDIYMGGAWPLIFTYTINSPNDLLPTDGAYIYIYHDRLVPAFQVVNFIASTCDFSMNNDDSSQFKFEWGARNSCLSYPNSDIRYGINFAAANNDSTKGVTGSGVVFKQPALKSGKVYSVLIWIVADVCGRPNHLVSSDTNNFSDPLDSSTAATTFINFSFTIAVYRKVTQTSSTIFSTSDLLAVKNNNNTRNKCWSVFRGQNSLSAPTEFSGYEYYDSNNLQARLYNQPTLNTPASPNPPSTLPVQSASSKYDVLMYKEFTDPVFLAAPFAALPLVTSGYVFNVEGTGPVAAPATSKSAYGYQTDGTNATPA